MNATITINVGMWSSSYSRVRGRWETPMLLSPYRCLYIHFFVRCLYNSNTHMKSISLEYFLVERLNWFCSAGNSVMVAKCRLLNINFCSHSCTLSWLLFEIALSDLVSDEFLWEFYERLACMFGYGSIPDGSWSRSSRMLISGHLYGNNAENSWELLCGQLIDFSFVVRIL